MNTVTSIRQIFSVYQDNILVTNSNIYSDFKTNLFLIYRVLQALLATTFILSLNSFMISNIAWELQNLYLLFGALSPFRKHNFFIQLNCNQVVNEVNHQENNNRQPNTQVWIYQKNTEHLHTK